MLYQQLKTRSIKLSPKESCDFDAGTGVVLVPQSESKVFIHWLTDKGNIKATHTLACPTVISGKCKLINGLTLDASIQIIQLT